MRAGLGRLAPRILLPLILPSLFLGLPALRGLPLSWLQPAARAAAPLPADGDPGALVGTLLEDPRGAPDVPSAGGSCRALVATAEAPVELLLDSCPPVRQGWRLAVRGLWRHPRPAPHPLLSGPAERLARQGARLRLRVERLQVLARPATPIADLRRRIARGFVAAAGPERGGLLAALVLGSAVVPLPADLREAFRASGLSHALAASGFHLTVLLGAVQALGRELGRLPRLGLAAGAILGFLLLAGPQPSVVRAVLMGSVALLALELGRRGRPLAILALSAAGMVLLRPDWLADVGFQLSVAATAGLLVSARPLEEALRPRLPVWLRPGWSAPALAVPLAATIWTLPLQLFHFGVLPVYAIPANVAATPLLTPLTLGAMGLALPLALFAGLPGPLAWLLLGPLQLLAGVLVGIARFCAALPLAQWQVGRPQPLLVALFGLALLGLAVPQLGRPWRAAAAGSLALVVALQLVALRSDRLLLVHQDGAGRGRDWLIARHDGRAALIASRADPFSCRQSRLLATGLGIPRFDWALLLDPVAPADPACWRRQAGFVLAYGEETPPLAAGQSLASPGLAVTALSMDSHALELRYGTRRWWLLPDRQALWAWRRRDGRRGAAGGGTATGARADQPVLPGLWLGFLPSPQERQALLAGAGAPARVWLSGPPPARSPLPRGWRASGASGHLLDG